MSNPSPIPPEAARVMEYSARPGSIPDAPAARFRRLWLYLIPLTKAQRGVFVGLQVRM